MRTEIPVFKDLGDRALSVELGSGIDPGINAQVADLFHRMQRLELPGVVDLMPAYRSLLVIFDPLRTARQTLVHCILGCWRSAEDNPEPAGKRIEVPVVYGGRHGPDLNTVARHNGLSPDEVVRLHTGTVYRVFMIGFSPGFPYLGPLPDVLATPRRKNPRTRVARGSVGIAEHQTGIYSAASPGGWQIIGRTPMSLFDPHRQPPAPWVMGDRVEFRAIDPEEYDSWEP